MLGWLTNRRTTGALARLASAHAFAGTFSGAVLVARRGRVLLREGYGRARLDPDRGNTPDTGFRIGSVAKTFTALTVMRLVEQGRLALVDPLSRWLPDFPDANRIRLEHLLSNRSGIPDFLMMEPVLRRIGEPHSLSQIIRYFEGAGLLFDPGDRLSYSNSNWTLLAAIVERATDQSFATALDQQVLRPAELAATYLDLEAVPRPNSARGYTLTESGMVPASPIHMSLEVGGGAMRSTVDDLLRLQRSLHDGRIVSPATLARMTAPLAIDNGVGYGLGFFTETRGSRTTVGHSGGTLGFTAFWSHYPAEDTTVVVLANLDNGSAEPLERDLAAVVFGEPYRFPAEVPTVVVPREALLPLLGRYRSEFAGRAIDFTVIEEAGQLFAEFPLLPRAKLRPVSPSRFLTRLKGGEVTFVFEAEGARIGAIEMDWSGRRIRCPRLD